MPRINIEDEFFVDVGRVTGADKIKSYDEALGVALRWIRFGQDKFRKGKRISVDEFKEQFPEALIPVFAKVDGEFVTVVGAKNHFTWLQKKKDAGKKGGESKQTEANASKPEQTEASPSPSPSPSELKTLAVADGKAPAQKATPLGEMLGRDETVNLLFNQLPESVRDDLLERFTKASLNATIRNCVNHYAAEKKPIDIAHWPTKIVTWINREVKTLKPVKPKPPGPYSPEPPFDPAAEFKPYVVSPGVEEKFLVFVGQGDANAG